jgi:hypothetical protein
MLEFHDTGEASRTLRSVRGAGSSLASLMMPGRASSANKPGARARSVETWMHVACLAEYIADSGK